MKAIDLNITDQLSFATTRIKCSLTNGDISTGTGFIVNFMSDDAKTSYPLIITNKHVVSDAQYIEVQFIEKINGQPDYNKKIRYRYDQSHVIHHPEVDVDLCALPYGQALNGAHKEGKDLCTTHISIDLIATQQDFDQLSALENIVMIGYPSGLYDEKHNMPLFRKGTTASRADLDFNGKKEFVIDAACFPGSSGSPVLLFNMNGFLTKTGEYNFLPSEIKLLGTLYAGPMYSANGELMPKPIPTNTLKAHMPMNLGYIIKAEKILDLRKLITIK